MPSAVVDALFEVAPVFAGFGPRDREDLLEIALEETYAAGLEIISQGAPARSMFVLAEGTVEVIDPNEPGEGLMLATLIPPCTLGDVAFFEAGRHTVTGRALTPIRVLSIERVGLDRLIERHSLAAYKLALNVLLHVAGRIRRLDAWIAQEFPRAAEADRQQWSDFRARLYQAWDI